MFVSFTITSRSVSMKSNTREMFDLWPKTSANGETVIYVKSIKPGEIGFYLLKFK